MLELLLASNEIDLIHFDGDPTLEILIQECQLVSSVAQAKPKNSSEDYTRVNTSVFMTLLHLRMINNIYLWPLPFVKHHKELLYQRGRVCVWI